MMPLPFAIMSSFGDVLAVGALVCGLATWIFPPLRIAMSRKKKSSLATVGFFIGVFVVIACLSAAGLLLALLAFALAERTSFAWYGLYAIAAFWMSVVAAMIYDDIRRSRDRPKQTDKR
jgi:hypothetical protein